MVVVKTYQDLLAISQDESSRARFVNEVITDHKASELYRTAVIADEYSKHRNVTISKYKKLLYKLSGQAVEDRWGSNYKLACRHFHRFITQENQFLLGNGVTWEDEKTAEKLGNKRYPFDVQLQKAGKEALIGGVSFGLFNYDHIDVFSVTEFAPLYDEENGALKAGVRFWQIDSTKPLRATLYEMDGYTEYVWYKDRILSGAWRVLSNGLAIKDKRAYKITKATTEADGEAIYSGENYPTFPIVPLWGNQEHQSEFVGLREQIDCYDLIKSGFCNTVDESSIVYWTLKNASGMDDIDVAKFLQELKLAHAARTDDEVDPQPHTIEPPYASREALLTRLDKDLYRDAMALNTEDIAGGSTTATQIKAAYEPLNAKCDSYEYCVINFIQGILEIAGIEDNPTFTRSMLINVTESIQSLSQAAAYLPEEYVTRKMLTLLGDGDKADEYIAQMQADDLPKIEE